MDPSIDTPLFDALPAKYQIFVREYAKGNTGKESAILAGYAPRSSEDTACRLLKRDDICAALKEVCPSGPTICSIRECREILSEIARKKDSSASANDRIKAVNSLLRVYGVGNNRSGRMLPQEEDNLFDVLE